MKKQKLNKLTFKKTSISLLSIKGGWNSDDTSDDVTHNPESMDILKCSPDSAIANSDCTCA